MPASTETAIIVAVPEVESVVGPLRARFDAAASRGVPAHVTILYPFLHPETVTDEVVQRLCDVVGQTVAFECSFAETRWFGRDVLWLAPDPDEPFRRMTGAVTAAFPTHPPYGGVFGNDLSPHLTVAETRMAASVDEVTHAEGEVRRSLPLHARVVEALLMVGTTAPDSWRVIARLPLSP